MSRNHPTCGHRSKEGHLCILYKNHYGAHKSDHLKDEWTDEDQ